MVSIEEIDQQVVEAPLSKEEAKGQFVRKKEHRAKLVEFESRIQGREGVLTGDAKDSYNPLKHTFAGGCYVREIFMPVGQLLVTKIHKKKHPFFLMSGEMSILTEDGVQRIQAPYNGITHPGTKRIIYTHTDCVLVTVHATDKTDVESVEEEVIAKDFNDPEITEYDIQLLTGGSLT